jgi:hypothetical protein
MHYNFISVNYYNSRNINNCRLAGRINIYWLGKQNSLYTDKAINNINVTNIKKNNLDDVYYSKLQLAILLRLPTRS